MKKPPRNKALPLTITLGSILVVLTVALTTMWNIILILNSLKLKELAKNAELWQQWVILGVGSFLFVVIITGIVLFIVFMSRQIILNQMQKTFIDSMTHELKTPLTSLKLYIETLKRHELKGEKRQEFLETMLNDVEYLDSLVGHVLESARIEYQRKPESFEDLNLADLVKESVNLIEPRYQLTRGTIQLELTDMPLHSDPHALRLVLVNLIDNAVKYSDDAPVVKVWLETEADVVKIHVSDQGKGIAAQEQKRIFRRFYRGNAMDGIKGTGLGLFIVREALRQVRGKIEVHSPGLNQGSTFTVILPR